MPPPDSFIEVLFKIFEFFISNKVSNILIDPPKMKAELSDNLEL